MWLTNDPDVQCLYHRLLTLRKGLQTVSHDPTYKDVDDLLAKSVITKLNRRFRLTCTAGITAAVIAVLGVFSGAFTDPIGQLTFLPTASIQSDDALQIALDHPPISIPKPAVVNDASSALEAPTSSTSPL
jgi:hypothetical protein